LWSPGGIEREGFTVKLLAAGGRYLYHSGKLEVRGDYELLSVMAGYRFKRDRSEFTVYGGPDLQAHRLFPDDLGNRLRGRHWGVRGGGDGWYQPSDGFMANGSVSLSTIGLNYWIRGAVGWYLFDFAWLGPELTAFGGHRYQQYRVGAHATAFRWSAFEFSIGFGYARDSDERHGFYGRFGVLLRGNGLDSLMRYSPDPFAPAQ
jgi:Cellulose biosynthesis protein BcsS